MLWITMVHNSTWNTINSLLLLLLFRSELDYASVVWNSITSTDAKKLERIQLEFHVLCFKLFFLQVN
jgi:hypothetical protein